MDLFLFISAVGAGFLLLAKGAGWLVSGGVGIASRFSLSRTVIGLTIVSYGTSFPEFMVSTVSSITGASGIAVGNVVGSNIANIGLILGSAMLIAPASASAELVRRDVPLLLAASLSMLFILWDGTVSRAEGLALFASGILYTLFLTNTGSGQQSAEASSDDDIPDEVPESVGKATALALAGAASLALGAEAVVYGGKGLGHIMGLSDRVIGLTVVAVGTSLPELFASVVAAIRGESGIAFGNVVGSNVFNILFVLGAASAISPISVSSSLDLMTDLAVMSLFTVMLVPMVSHRRQISRWEGAFLLVLYAAYWVWIGISQGIIIL